MSNTRTRTITWEDPRGLAKAAVGLSGLEYLQKIVAGELPPPPIGALMNFRIGELSEGRAVFIVEPAEYHYNPIGVVHGGLAATLLDSAMGCAVHSTLANVRRDGHGPLRSEHYSRGRPDCDG